MVRRPTPSSEGVGRLTRRFGRGREALLDVWEGSGGTPAGLGGFESLSQSFWMGQEANLECWERSKAHL